MIVFAGEVSQKRNECFGRRPVVAIAAVGSEAIASPRIEVNGRIYYLAVGIVDLFVSREKVVTCEVLVLSLGCRIARCTRRVGVTLQAIDLFAGQLRVLYAVQIIFLANSTRMLVTRS